MAGIPHPYFDWDDSIPDFLAQLRLDLQNREIDINDNVADSLTGRDNTIGHLRACMRGKTLEWFDDEITTKQNWKLTNLLDNTGQANLVAVNGRTSVQIGANALNEAVGQPENTIVKLRAVEDAWNEDWRIAGGRPTNALVKIRQIRHVINQLKIKLNSAKIQKIYTIRHFRFKTIRKFTKFSISDLK
ncbi:unnamed protein product [Rhizophagus irregularis]|nr:unnamed protein product [Rhizophagus irregularis]